MRPARESLKSRISCELLGSCENVDPTQVPAEVDIHFYVGEQLRRLLNFVDDDLFPCRVEEKAGIGQGPLPGKGIVKAQVRVIGQSVHEER